MAEYAKGEEYTVNKRKGVYLGERVNDEGHAVDVFEDSKGQTFEVEFDSGARNG